MNASIRNWATNSQIEVVDERDRGEQREPEDVDDDHRLAAVEPVGEGAGQRTQHDRRQQPEEQHAAEGEVRRREPVDQRGRGRGDRQQAEPVTEARQRHRQPQPAEVAHPQDRAQLGHQPDRTQPAVDRSLRAAPGHRRTAARRPAVRSARPAVRPPRPRGAASGRTESGLPGSEGGQTLSLGGLTVPAGVRRPRHISTRTGAGIPAIRVLRDGSGRAVDGRPRPAGTRPPTSASPASGPGPSSTWSAGWTPTAPATVVDLGCGEGTMTATLAERWPAARVTGVDSSPEMLAAAAASAVPGRVEFVAGDVRDWAPDGPVDVVVSNAVLHWVPGHDAAARPAGPGGCAPGGWLGGPGAGQLPRPDARAARRPVPLAAVGGPAGRRGAAAGRRPRARRLPRRPHRPPACPPTCGRRRTCTC